MDPIHIHNLLRQLSNEVHCPHCDAKVHPEMITVENLSQNFCFLNINCYACGEVFHGHAHVGVKISAEGTESEIPSSEEIASGPPLFSTADIESVHEALQNGENLPRFFPKRNDPKLV